MRRAIALLIAATPAWAHEGHGAANPHMHGWDSLGLLLLAGAAAAAAWLWLKGRGK